jgi:hypothetical protein
MNAELLIGLLLSIGALTYLTNAMLRPEMF